MGVDAGHMCWERLAQAMPPVYAELMFGQAAMQEAHRRFGVPAITHDEMRASPERSRRTLASWLVGAGAAHEAAGLDLQPAAEGGSASGARASAGDEPWLVDGEPPTEEEEAPTAGNGAVATWEEASWSLSEHDFREVYYTHAGGYDQSLVGSSAPNWLGRFQRRRLDDAGEWEEQLRGRNIAATPSSTSLRARGSGWCGRPRACSGRVTARG